MQIRSLVGRGGTVALIAAALGLAIGGIAYASIPDSNGVIHACYNTGANPSGALRVIDTGLNSTCSKNEKSLSWNQRGPTGPAGSNGTNGTPGTTGPTGPTGPKGSDATVNGYATRNTHVIDAGDENHEQLLIGLSGLPGGDYLVWSTLTNSGGDDAECDLQGPGGSVQPYDPVRIRDHETVGISGAVTSAGGPINLLVYCWHDPGIVQDNPPTVHADIQALPVSTLQ